MSKDESIVIGHSYFMGIHMGLCRGPVDEIVQINVGGKTAWQGSVTASAVSTGTPTSAGNKTTISWSGGVYIAKSDLFGGDEKEGGIDGPLDIMMGTPDQTVNPRLAAMLGGIVPAFRGVVTAFFDGLVCAMSPYPKPWSFRMRRALKGWDDDNAWYPEKARIVMTDSAGNVIHAMNPAHILYECLTNRDWGRGFERALLDDAVWRAAADELYAEGFGLCLKWSRSDSLSAFIGGVINHIGAVFGVHRGTGLLVTSLIREGYVVGDLPLFTADTGLLSIEDDSAGSASGATNEIIVKYKRPVDNSDGQVRVQILASIEKIGRATQTNDYPGIPTAALALRVAQRDLRSSAGFVKRYKVRLDRRGYQIAPGSVFCISDPVRGITNMVLRAGRVEDGLLTGGEIIVVAVQDIFGLPATSYGGSQGSGWQRPNSTPAAVATRRLIETSYRDLALRLSDADLAAVASTAGFMQILAVRPTVLSLDYRITTRIGGSGDFVDQGAGHFASGGLVTAAMTPTTTSITVTDGQSLDLIDIGSAAMIDNEVVRVETLNTITGAMTIARGCADTVPAAHSAGARIWFYDRNFSASQEEFTSGTTAQAKLLTHTGSGTLDASLAAIDSLTFSQRQIKPYAPGQFKINTVAYPASIIGTLAVSWAHRNRVTQADQLIDTSVASITPEAGTTYRLRIYNGATLKHTYSGITGTSQSYLTADELADGGPFTSLRVVLDSLRDGIYSAQSHDWTVTR